MQRSRPPETRDFHSCSNSFSSRHISPFRVFYDVAHTISLLNPGLGHLFCPHRHIILLILASNAPPLLLLAAPKSGRDSSISPLFPLLWWDDSYRSYSMRKMPPIFPVTCSHARWYLCPFLLLEEKLISARGGERCVAQRHLWGRVGVTIACGGKQQEVRRSIAC